jgi:hypothetical protein
MATEIEIRSRLSKHKKIHLAARRRNKAVQNVE